MKRKFSNDELFPLYSYYKNNGMSISKTGKKFKLSYSDAYYRIKEYERRLSNGEDNQVLDTNNNIVRVKLNPIVTTYPDMENAWSQIYDRFNHEDRAIIFKFYNTVLQNAGVLTKTDMSYEQ